MACQHHAFPATHNAEQQQRKNLHKSGLLCSPPRGRAASQARRMQLVSSCRHRSHMALHVCIFHTIICLSPQRRGLLCTEKHSHNINTPISVQRPVVYGRQISITLTINSPLSECSGQSRTNGPALRVLPIMADCTEGHASSMCCHKSRLKCFR